MKKTILSLATILLSLYSFAQRDAALKAYNYENYRTAVKLFNAVIKSDGANGENYYLLGNAYCRLGKFDSARTVYDMGTKAAPKYGPNYAGLAKTYLNENNSAKALELFQDAKSTTNNKDVNYYIWVADAYTNNSKPNTPEAINQLKKSLEINYKDAGVYMALGEANYVAENGGDAVSNYELASQYNPALVAPYAKIGFVWTSARKYNESLASFQKALTIDPDYAPALRGLSELYFSTVQYDKAKETYEHFMKVADIDDDVKYKYAQYLFLNKDYTGAINLINELLKTNDTRAIMYRLAAYSNYELGNYDEAIEQLNTFFTKTEPKKILASDYEYVGKLQAKKGNDSLVIVNYLKAIEMDTTKKGLYNDIASMFYAKKNYKQAAKYYDLKINSLSQPAVQDYFSLGRAYYFDNAYAKADTAFIKVTELTPTSPYGYLWRARSNINLDNTLTPTGLALPHYLKVIELGTIDSVSILKYKKELIESYQYVGDFTYNNQSHNAALLYYEKLLALTPENTQLSKLIISIKADKKK